MLDYSYSIDRGQEMTSDEIAKNLLLDRTCNNCSIIGCKSCSNTCKEWKSIEDVVFPLSYKKKGKK